MNNDLIGIRKTGNNITELSKQMADNVKKMNWIIDKLGASWQGTDATMYIESLKNDYLSQLQKTVEVIENYGAYLVGVSKIYQEIETNAVNESRG